MYYVIPCVPTNRLGTYAFCFCPFRHAYGWAERLEPPKRQRREETPTALDK